MSDNNLPEDYELWPSDPYELLGVARRSDPKEIKRAYTRLIKQFKPEHFPEQFRLLREAFDRVNTRSVSWDWDAESKPRAFSKSISSIQSDRIDLQDSLHRDAEDPTTKIWELAKNQGIQCALAVIQESSWPAHLKTKICLIEYWLRKTRSPKPDTNEAAQFLLERLHRCVDSPTAMNLARTELIAHPELSLLIDLQKSFRKENSLYRLTELLRMRWEAASQTQEHQQILSDYQLFSERYFEHRETWDGVTITVINFLMWSKDKEIQKRCDEILSNLERDSGLRSSVVEALTQIDYLKKTATEFHKISNDNPQLSRLLDLVPSMWNSIESRFVAKAAAWLVEASGDLASFLSVFDGLAKDSPTLLLFIKSSLSRVIGIYSSNNEEDSWEKLGEETSGANDKKSEDRLKESIRRFLTTINSPFYVVNRKCLLQFFVDNQMKIETFATYIQATKDKIAVLFKGTFVDSLKSDTSLQAILELMTRLEKAL